MAGVFLGRERSIAVCELTHEKNVLDSYKLLLFIHIILNGKTATVRRRRRIRLVTSLQRRTHRTNAFVFEKYRSRVGVRVHQTACFRYVTVSVCNNRKRIVKCFRNRSGFFCFETELRVQRTIRRNAGDNRPNIVAVLSDAVDNA